ncbi:MAG: alpha/beta hydrolase [Anaerolineales bacterium]
MGTGQSRVIGRLEVAVQDVVRTPGFKPDVSHHYIRLPKTNLHYIKCGDGPPLIMVPATISKIENWLALAQFMGQRFTVYFFELPGHGTSSPFPEPFCSRLAAETVEDFIDRLGYETVSLMGFSFGGILAVTSLARLRRRVEKIILLSPAVTRRALKYSRNHLWLLRRAVRILRIPKVRASTLYLIRSSRFNGALARFFAKVGKVEKSIPMGEVFQKLTESTADVLCYQIAEMLDFEMELQAQPFSQPCYFAMSVRDPLLDFETTLETMKRHFETVHVERFDFPYHQPPQPLTFEEVVDHHGPLLEYICHT